VLSLFMLGFWLRTVPPRWLLTIAPQHTRMPTSTLARLKALRALFAQAQTMSGKKVEISAFLVPSADQHQVQMRVSSPDVCACVHVLRVPPSCTSNWVEGDCLL
jgi:hypothetical protein